MKLHFIFPILLIHIAISIRADKVQSIRPVKADELEPKLLAKEDETKSASEKRSVAPSAQKTGSGTVNALPNGLPSIKILSSNSTTKNMGRSTVSVDGKSTRKRVNWPLSQQIGWIESRPYKGWMYAQKGINGRLCRLGPEGPECSEEDSSEIDPHRNVSGRLEKYRGSGYDEDCHIDELDGLRHQVRASTISESTKRIVADQNVMIRRAFIARALGKFNASENQEPKNGFMLFDKMMTLVHNICPESTIPQTFLNSLTFYLKELHASVSPSRTPYIGDDDFTWISNILNKCGDRTKSNYRASTDKLCKAEVNPVGGDGKYLCPGPPLDESFHYIQKIYDPAMDSIWHIFSAIQYLCFEDFAKDSSRMFHHFGTAIMDLLTAPMKLKWTNQIEVHFNRLYQRLQGPFYEIYLSNVERCVVYIRDKVSLNNLKIPRFYSYGSVRILAS